MFKLIGYRAEYEYGYEGMEGDRTDIEIVLATFDDKKEALRYVKMARLKSPSDSVRPFKKKSLLANCAFADIVEEVEENIPHNPNLT